MKKLYSDRVISILLVTAWMVFVFMLSQQSAAASSETSGNVIEKIAELVNRDFNTLAPSEKHDIIASWQSVVRQAAHFSEYAVLGFLVVNALRTYNLKKALRCLLPPLVCFLYAVSDEVHQIFVPGRSCELQDIITDTLGGIVGTAVFLFAWRIVRRIKYKRTAKRKIAE